MTTRMELSVSTTTAPTNDEGPTREGRPWSNHPCSVEHERGQVAGTSSPFSAVVNSSPMPAEMLPQSPGFSV